MLMNFKKFGAGAKVALCSLMVALIGGVNTAFAQIDGSQMLDAGTSAGKNLIASLVRFLQIGLGIGALVTLVMVIYNLFKQEREAAIKLVWWVVGLAVGFALMTALSNMLQGV